LTKQQRNKDFLKGFPVLILLILGIWFLKSTAVDSNSPDAVPADGDVFVQVEGDVEYPGVYSFDHEPGVDEVLGKAKTGKEAAVNPAAGLLHSGCRVTVLGDKDGYIYSYGEISAFNKITLGLPVSINTESEEGLAAVPGIGRSLAGEVVRERKRRGGFKRIEELRSVSGIGDKKYKTIVTYVTL
jgi:competence protein ComEA